jgi:hypothetical protein
MPKSVLAITALLVALISKASAAPPDEPGTIYIDGQPCGSFCQLFVDPPQPPPEQVPRGRPRTSAIVSPIRGGGRRHRNHYVDVPLPKVRPTGAPVSVSTQVTMVAPPAATSNAEIADAPLTLENVVEIAGRLTMDAERANSQGSADAETTGSVPKDDTRVALVIVRDGIHAIGDLAGKSVAIDSDLSGSDPNIRLALVAAGAPEVQISEDQAKAIDRLLRDEVPAAVLGLVLREAADNVPEIKGYRIFRVPLSPI